LLAQRELHAYIRRGNTKTRMPRASTSACGSLDRVGLALAALIALYQDDREALGLLRRLARRVRPTVAPRI
jgi:hypothetical protein